MSILKEIRTHLNLDQKHLAALLGMEQGSVSDIERERIGLSKKIQGKLISILGVSKNYIETGIGPILDIKEQNLKISHDADYFRKKAIDIIENQIPFKSNPKTPYYPNINAAAGLSHITNNNDIEISYMDIPNSGADFFINIFGDSMYPKYCSGEIVGLKPIEKEFVMFGHAYVVELSNGECYIKYIKKGKKSDHWLLANENKHYDEREFHISQLSKIYMIKIVLTKTTI